MFKIDIYQIVIESDNLIKFPLKRKIETNQQKNNTNNN